MKRKNKLLILLGVLTLLLSATWVASLLASDTAEDTPTVVTVFSAEADRVTALSWTDSNETLEFIRGDAGWYYAQDPDFPLDASYIDTILADIAAVTAEKNLENPGNLSDYGLDEPVCTVTVTASDTVTTLSIGDSSLVAGELYLSNGDGNIYLVDSGLLDTFSYSLYDLIAYETIPVMETVTSMQVQANGVDMLLTYQENNDQPYWGNYTWFLGEQALDTELTESFLSSVTGVSWNSCANYDTQDLSAYGLDTPAVTVTVGYTQSGNAMTFMLELGSDTDDGCYARIAGSKMVYLVDGDLKDTLLYTTAQELRPDEVLLMDPATLTAVTVALDGSRYEMVRTIQEITDEEGSITEETVYLYGDTQVDLDAILETVAVMVSTGYADTVPSGALELVFSLTQDDAAVELCFYRYDSTSCLVTVNGEPTVFVAREDVVSLKEDINTIVTE